MVNFNEIDKGAREQMLIGNMEYEEENFITEAKHIQHTIGLVLKYKIDDMPFYFMDNLIEYIFGLKRAYANYCENKFDLKCLSYESEEE